MIEPLPVCRAAELAEPEPDKRWLVESLWARSAVGIIGGAPKSAKTWLALDLCLSVASGSDCLDRFAVDDPGAVLAYFAEDAAGDVKQRLSGLCRYRDRSLERLPIDVITASALRLDLDRDQHRLAETVRRLGPRLLILDPFVRLHRLDENSAADVSRLLAYLRALQRDHDVAVAVVHHIRKNGSAAHAGQSLRGSGDFHAWTDSALYLRRSREKLMLTIEHRSARSADPIALSLEGDGDAARLQIDDHGEGDDRDPATGDRLDELVLEAVEHADAPISRRRLRALLRVKNERLGVSLERLLARGELRRAADGWCRADVVPRSPP